ncbi:hypothetical protein [Streptomyces sp. NPDC017991]|uniref:hypothetical protein n=1 Tax=Streptomyces sp. NPDC017991 TaxID=3365026 RepID=UPI0037A5B4E2
MTHQRTDGVPSAAAPGACLEALRERLAADGCAVTATDRDDHRVLIGSRSDRKVRWFGTRVELFVLAAAVPTVDSTALAEFTGWALTHVKGLRGGLPGARDATRVLPALVSGSVQRSAARWAAEDARILGTSLIARPLTVETSAPGAARVTMYAGGVVWGGMFTRHVLEKAALYYP